MFNFQRFHRQAKIKFAMKRKRSALCPSLDVMNNPTRRATPSEDSPIGQLFNDEGIQALVGEVKGHDNQIRDGKKFLISLQGLMYNSTEESANDIYCKARHIWDYGINLMSSCAYAIYKERSLCDKLAFYANQDAPVQRMASMMKDPWLEYILGDRVLGLKKSDAFIRGFLSILIAYWNMKDLFDKYELRKCGYPPTSTYIPPDYEKHYEYAEYVIDHRKDLKNLREVLQCKYGSDPDLVASLFKQISMFQFNEMSLLGIPTGKRVMIKAMLCSERSGPLYFSEVYVYRALP